MERGNEEFSDKKVVIFLIAAIFISLVSTLTVMITLHNVTSTEETKTAEPPPSAGSGLISLTILNNAEPTNGTK